VHTAGIPCEEKLGFRAATPLLAGLSRRGATCVSAFVAAVPGGSARRMAIARGLTTRRAAVAARQARPAPFARRAISKASRSCRPAFIAEAEQTFDLIGFDEHETQSIQEELARLIRQVRRQH
jgi:hypothetical protein